MLANFLRANFVIMLTNSVSQYCRKITTLPQTLVIIAPKKEVAR